MTDKLLTDMTDDEIIAEIQMLRERRAQARERRITEKSAALAAPKKKESGVSDTLWDILTGTEETEP